MTTNDVLPRNLRGLPYGNCRCPWCGKARRKLEVTMTDRKKQKFKAWIKVLRIICGVDEPQVGDHVLITGSNSRLDRLVKITRIVKATRTRRFGEILRAYGKAQYATREPGVERLVLVSKSSGWATAWGRG